MAVNHYPWDEGVLSTVGLIVGQKTIKAYCGKRVNFSSADSDKPVTCAGCCMKMREQADAIESLMSLYETDSKHAKEIQTHADKLRENAAHMSFHGS